MRDKSILKKLKAFREFDGAITNRYPAREGLLKFITAGNVIVKWYSRGKIGVQIGNADTIGVGIRELSDVISEVI
ncbi:hypothetical protein L963_1343 [Leuconostoc mesenteroides subsp. cremoris T26]|nr:hypothetical protein L963_1343 [Leuconostoc mesenteroides subsp. cremoris T26]